MTMYRINVAWQNWPGAPGVSTFFQDPAVAQPNPEAVQDFFDAIKGMLPTGLTLTVPSSGDLINEATGAITGNWSVTPAPALITCTGAGSYAGNAGMVVHWLTGGIVHDRRVRARTFIVPTISTQFESNGSPSSAALNTLSTAAAALVSSTANHLVAWSRPFDGAPNNPARAGSKHAITSHRVPDLAISLRSRRI